MKLFEVLSPTLNGIVDQHAKDITTAKDVISFYNNCSDHINCLLKEMENEDAEPPFLYRGTHTTPSGIDVIVPRKRKKSLTGNNMYMNLVSDERFEAWNKFPKRNNSIFLTTSMSHAKDFGSVVVCFLYNNSKIGITPKGSGDFNFAESWNHDGIYAAFIKQIVDKSIYTTRHDSKAVDDMMWSTDTSLDDLKTIDAAFKQTNKSFEDMMETLVQHYSNMAMLNNIQKLFKDNNCTTLEHAAKLLLDPDRNKFIATTSKHVCDYINSAESREIWTDSPVRVLSVYEYMSILKVISIAKKEGLL